MTTSEWAFHTMSTLSQTVLVSGMALTITALVVFVIMVARELRTEGVF